MKKLVVLLALSMLSALASCANGAADKGGVPAPQASNAQTETSEPSPTGTSEPAPADGVSGEAPDLGASVTSYTLENATLGGLTAAADDFTLTLIGENTLSGKLKASGNLTITGDGSLTISSGADDCINANGDITIDGGTLILSTQDDAVHSDAGLTINGGSVNILKSLEGLEAMVVTINGGDTRIAASDDAINASDGGTEEVAAQNPQGGRGGFGGDMVNNPALSVNITGGGVRLYAGTDGIDSNGGIVISGGTVLSFSTAAQTGGEGPIDVYRLNYAFNFR
ncbi:MAG: carbohydrate-binding domain-containing protein, partial [Oscillospiraceae bacterium]|nr:carbohydrate-binding domain-containing protein [Oscillospiraceae bacterium]